MNSAAAHSILLVDDDPHTCAIFELLMEHYRIPCQVANDAEMALEMLERYEPTVIVVDLFLPGIDGFHALHQIRERTDRAQVKILATTAYYTKDTRRDVLAHGFDGYLPKPFLPETFAPFLREPDA